MERLKINGLTVFVDDETKRLSLSYDLSRDKASYLDIDDEAEDVLYRFIQISRRAEQIVGVDVDSYCLPIPGISGILGFEFDLAEIAKRDKWLANQLRNDKQTAIEYHAHQARREVGSPVIRKEFYDRRTKVYFPTETLIFEMLWKR